MDFKGLKVLVLDGDGRQIPSVLTELHKLGCESTTVNGARLDIGMASRYPKKKILVKGVLDNPELLYETVKKEILSGGYDIVMPMVEKATDMLLSHAEEFSPYVKIAAAPYIPFQMAYDKQKTMELCMKNGVPCPITKMDDETLDEYMEKVSPPYALKPRKGTGSIGFKCVKSKDELRKLVDDRVIIPEEYIIQEYIPQTEKQYSVYMFFDDASEVKSTVVAEHCRWFPLDGGPGCFVRTIDDRKMADDCITLMKAMGWSGFCQPGLIMDPRDGVAKVLEINGRIPAGIKICEMCGHKIVKQMVERAMGCDVTDYGYNSERGICLRYSQADFLWFLKSPDRFHGDPPFFSHKKTKDYIFSCADPMPYLSFTLQHILSFGSDMKKRKR